MLQYDRDPLSNTIQDYKWKKWPNACLVRSHIAWVDLDSVILQKEGRKKGISVTYSVFIGPEILPLTTLLCGYYSFGSGGCREEEDYQFLLSWATVHVSGGSPGIAPSLRPNDQARAGEAWGCQAERGEEIYTQKAQQHWETPMTKIQINFGFHMEKKLSFRMQKGLVNIITIVKLLKVSEARRRLKKRAHMEGHRWEERGKINSQIFYLLLSSHRPEPSPPSENHCVLVY
nr:PREDICTED: uncharacterized protein LOC104141279 [Struthio camelus australis]